MKVILFGATGMVGQGVLRECLLDSDVTQVLSVARRSTGAEAGQAARAAPQGAWHRFENKAVNALAAGSA